MRSFFRSWSLLRAGLKYIRANHWQNYLASEISNIMCISVTGGAYAPDAPCMSTLLSQCPGPLWHLLWYWHAMRVCLLSYRKNISMLTVGTQWLVEGRTLPKLPLPSTTMKLKSVARMKSCLVIPSTGRGDVERRSAESSWVAPVASPSLAA